MSTANTEAVRRYRQRHPDRVKDAQKKWRATNKERTRELQRIWRERHIEKCREKDRQRSQRGTPAKRAEYTRRYKARYPERVRARKRRHYHLLATNDPRVKAMYLIAGWLRERGDDVQVDHIMPLSKGGTHTIDNLQILPTIENKRKGAKLPCCI